MHRSSRRRALQSGLGCLTALTVGCSGLDAADRSTSTSNGDGTDEQPSVRRPNVTLQLTVENATPHSLSVEARYVGTTERSASTDASVLYHETVELEPGDVIDLEPYRPDTQSILTVSVGSNTLFDRTIQPHEGHRLSIVSETDVEVETVVE